MPNDRSSRPPGSGSAGRGRSSGRPRQGGNKQGRGNQRKGGSRGGSSSGGRSSAGGRERPEPRTEAERRAANVRATRGPRRTPRTEEGERAKIEGRQVEEWVDEGSIRAEAEAATKRASGGQRTRRPAEIDATTATDIRDAVDPKRAERLTERLASASAALDRERFDEARRMVTPLVKELPQVAAVHEIAGLAAYRTGRWRQAAQSLELARQLRPDPALMPVLADCYRAQKRWRDVDEIWREVREMSPNHEIMAEARIVAAGAQADRGELADAIATMEPATKAPTRVRDHHLRQWYVLADLYDRAGDPVAASRWFREIAARDGDFADVKGRLRALGR